MTRSLSRGLTLPRLLKRPSIQYLLILCGLGVAFLLRCPIILTDTDLWYHLTGGRYLFEHGMVPHNSFFSFLTPPREWVDYFWMFQGVVYTIYSGFGYVGLILFRAAAYGVVIALVIRYLFERLDNSERVSWCAFLAVLYAVLFMPRFLLVRPHMLTYGFIIAFLWILEYHPRRAWCLPGLAVLWCNLHGIEYPVLLLIVGSYALEQVLKRFRGQVRHEQAGRLALAPLALSMAAILLTPHGFRLLGMPFRTLGYISKYVNELSTLTLSQLGVLELSVLSPFYLDFFKLIALFSGLALITALLQRKIRISHLLMWGGGLVLVTAGHRFIYEYVLLSLPLLKAHPICSPHALARHVPRPAQLSLVILLALMPLMFVKDVFRPQPAYPFSHQGLPHGVATFLNRVGVGGRVLNDPNTGGYLQWMLYPRYQIFMDMEVGPLFGAEDFDIGLHVFQDKETLRKVLARYEPDFITVPYEENRFEELIKDHPEYVVVFFDDAEVLYVNTRRHPDLASQYELRDVQPFQLKKKDLDTIEPGPAKEPLLKYLSRLLSIDPDCALLNYVAGTAANKTGAHDRALAYARAVIRNFPHRAMGYRLQGQALEGLGLLDQAAASYTVALDREGAGRDLYKLLGSVYMKQHRYIAAYDALKQSVDMLSYETSPEDLYLLGSAALEAGNRSDGTAVLRYLYEWRLGPGDTEWVQKVKQEFGRFGIEVPNGGVGRW